MSSSEKPNFRFISPRLWSPGVWTELDSFESESTVLLLGTRLDGVDVPIAEDWLEFEDPCVGLSELEIEGGVDIR